MDEGLLPTTRFSATEEAPGCTNCTVLPAPMLKLCQFRVARWLPWVMVIWLAVGVFTVAWPEVTSAPVGRAPLAAAPAM